MHYTKLSVLFLLISTVCIRSESYIIREAQETDFEAIEQLAFRTFTATYNITTSQDTLKLKNLCECIIEEELYNFHTNRQNMILLVAVYGEIIIGFFSANRMDNPHELYGRCFVIDTEFQSQGIGKALLKQCRALTPDVTKVVCMTNKKNNGSQKLYAYLGGTKVENPTWLHYLYKRANPADYIYYEFDEKVLQTFDKR